MEGRRRARGRSHLRDRGIRIGIQTLSACLRCIARSHGYGVLAIILEILGVPQELLISIVDIVFNTNNVDPLFAPRTDALELALVTLALPFMSRSPRRFVYPDTGRDDTIVLSDVD